MRVSGCGYVGKTIDEVKQLSKAVTEVTHNHPEGLKGAEATAVAVFLARTGKSLIEIQDYIIQNYYPLGFTLNSIRENYQFNETCQDTVPQALEAFFESTDFEDAIRNAISTAAIVIHSLLLPVLLPKPTTVCRPALGSMLLPFWTNGFLESCWNSKTGIQRRPRKRMILEAWAFRHLPVRK